MSDIVISVENLGKKYRIRHEQRERYTALRDVLARKVKGLGSSVLGMGHYLFGLNGTANSEHIPDTQNPTPDALTSDLRPPTCEDFWALKNVSFEVKQGEVVGIIGRNGAGKSTLLKILSRITEPTKGRVRIKGRVASLLEVGTGFHPELTGRENIFLNGAILGMTREEIKRKFDEIVTFAEIETFLDTPVKRYSSGMYVRLAFAVAAHLEPEILLVDEVLAVGDAAFQKKCLGKMGDVAKEGRTVLFVSHNLATLKQLCPTSFWLNVGKVQAYGLTVDIVESYLRTLDNGFKKTTCFLPEDTSKESQLRSSRILNEKGEEADNFSCDESVMIELVYQVHRQNPGLYAYFSVSREYGLEVLVSDSKDVIPNPFDNLPVGTHTLLVTIPARTLGHGSYQLYFSTASPFSTNFNVDVAGVIGWFNLHDYSSDRGNKRGGFLSTLLKWSIKSQKGSETTCFAIKQS
jgi:lipopolysaccharide transport system ATP-binding protein